MYGVAEKLVKSIVTHLDEFSLNEFDILEIFQAKLPQIDKGVFSPYNYIQELSDNINFRMMGVVSNFNNISRTNDPFYTTNSGNTSREVYLIEDFVRKSFIHLKVGPLFHCAESLVSVVGFIEDSKMQTPFLVIPGYERNYDITIWEQDNSAEINPMRPF